MLDRWMDRLCRVLDGLMVLALAAMVVMVFANVVLRYAFNSGLTLSEELSRWLFVWLVFVGAAVAVRDRAHMGVDVLVVRLPQPVQRAVLLVGHALMLWVTWLLLQGSWAQTRINWDTTAPVTGWSQAWLYAAGLVFAVLSGLWLLMDTWRLLAGRLSLADWHPQTTAPGHGQGDAQ
ncbi:TRAP transporter small permease [Tepidimonas aquatica]|uniref:TRAP transporter small permease protein n=1 Tax=Tepidimonas aquatica TaxID=247482 RepID=A0A554WMG4_9BURK|nr:TRAP transporter small permease [Tepidimonas aquatica]TSE24766.1 2,3-diketo-L-gulonate TRAP transporter small permease protein YiaM [Tepidimonas aquatica]